jgi:hypothetical protein
MHSKHPRITLTVTAFVLALAGGGAWWLMRQPAGRTSGTDPVSLQAAGLYADPAVCEECHSEIAATYRKTGMGRSFRKVRSEKDLGAAAPAKPFYHAASKSFLAWSSERRLVSTPLATGFDVRNQCRRKRVDYLLGSSNHSEHCCT